MSESRQGGETSVPLDVAHRIWVHLRVQSQSLCLAERLPGDVMAKAVPLQGEGAGWLLIWRREHRLGNGRWDGDHLLHSFQEHWRLRETPGISK